MTREEIKQEIERLQELLRKEEEELKLPCTVEDVQLEVYKHSEGRVFVYATENGTMLSKDSASKLRAFLRDKKDPEQYWKPFEDEDGVPENAVQCGSGIRNSRFTLTGPRSLDVDIWNDQGDFLGMCIVGEDLYKVRDLLNGVLHD